MAEQRRSPRPSVPWQPVKITVSGVYPRTRRVWVRDDRVGRRVRKPQRCFDARFRVDGHAFRRTFDQRGWADDYVRTLHEGFASGWPFDPVARRFVDPESLVPDVGPTFFEHARDYINRKWLDWAPASRRNGQRELARAVIELVTDDAPELTLEERVHADHYLRAVWLMYPPPDDVDESDRAWEEWFLQWSLLLRSITDDHLHVFLSRARTGALDGTTRTASASSMQRLRATVRGAFSNAMKRRLIEWDPWTAIDPEQLRDHEQVDPDLVMDPPQVLAIAGRCGVIDARYEPFVLAMGQSGLRPSEAINIRRRDLDLTIVDDAAFVVRSSYTPVPERFLLEGETRDRPLKGRGAKVRRRVPVPRQLALQLASHVQKHVDKDPDAFVFANTEGGRIDLSNFSRDVWNEARADLFPEGSPLRQVRRHDLRHSAITAWLNAGVPLKTAQIWSGHRTASTLLDTYLGVMRHDEVLGRSRIEDVFDQAAA